MDQAASAFSSSALAQRFPPPRWGGWLSLLGALGVLAAFSVTTADAQDLVTDRPDQTESATVVPRGTVQVELGATLFREEVGGDTVEARELAQTLVRVGLAERWELRLGWDGHQRLEVPGRGGFDVSGVGDAAVGFKWALREPGPQGLEMALLGATSVPVGDDELTSDAYDPELRLAVSHELASGAGLAYNVGLAQTSEPDGPTTDLAFATVAVGFSLTERLGSFVELFGEVPLDGEEESLSFDTGLTWLVNDLMQWDVAAGVGLNDPAPDWFVTVGFSWRFPR